MATILKEVTTKTESLEIDNKANVVTPNTESEAKMENEPTKTTEPVKEQVQEKMDTESNAEKAISSDESKNTDDVSAKEEMEKVDEKVDVEIEPKTGVSFPVKLSDGKKLNSVGMRKKTILGLGIKIYAFGIYADNEKLKEVMKSKIGKAPAKPTKEMYQAVIDSDVGMMVRLAIVYGTLTMSMVKKNFDEGLGASIKKLNGNRKNEELVKKVLGEATDDIKLPAGSIIEISRLPGYVLQTKVKDEEVSRLESELLCRAYIHMYLGDDPFDKEAKEKFGVSLRSLF